MITSQSRIRICFVALLLLLIGTVVPKATAESSWKQVIVKCAPEDLSRIQTELGAAVIDAVPGYYLLNVPAAIDVAQIEGFHGKSSIHASENSNYFLSRRQARNSSTMSPSLPALGSVVDWYGTPARQGYTNQAAGYKIGLKDALAFATGLNVRVAIIDTGVDEQHPTLMPVLLGGKNYVDSSPIPDELNDPIVQQSTAVILDQSTAAILDQSTAAILDQSTAAILDQSTAAILDQSTAAILDQLPAFGHGTMMAGLVHLAAPQARIIPLKAFDAGGSSTEWNLVRAIYDAMDMGADIINMSFSSSKNSKIMEGAIAVAVSRGVVLVAAAGNDSSDAPTYPAFLDSTVAVSSLDANDQKASFSNFGQYVDLSAPGVDLITTYPGGRFAIGSGTSDSVSLVSGVFATAKQRGTAGLTLRQKVEAGVDPLLQILPQYQNRLGKGRINALRAVN